MTWTMENRGSSPADIVAIISLKLHDYSKSPLGETEVKLQLTRDTLEAMLRSMTYIREQLNADVLLFHKTVLPRRQSPVYSFFTKRFLQVKEPWKNFSLELL